MIRQNHRGVQDKHFLYFAPFRCSMFRSNFLFLFCHNTVLMIWSGVGTETTWLGLEKYHSLAKKKNLLSLQQKGLEMVRLPVKRSWFWLPRKKHELWSPVWQSCHLLPLQLPIEKSTDKRRMWTWYATSVTNANSGVSKFNRKINDEHNLVTGLWDYLR